MLTIGIDPGTESTGYGIVFEDENGVLSAISYGVIKTTRELSAEYRLKKIYDDLSQILFLNRPDNAAVEKLFFQKNVTNAIAVGQARGVILLSLCGAKTEIAEYTPNEVKQCVTGYGNADKKQVQEMVRVLLALEKTPKPDDAADALAIAICHIRNYRIKSLAAGEK